MLMNGKARNREESDLLTHKAFFVWCQFPSIFGWDCYTAGMTRKPLVIGNWKMELSHGGSLELARALKKLWKGTGDDCEVVVCPSYPQLSSVGEALKNSAFQIGAQNVHWEETGPWTGMVSIRQVMPFARWSIVGHSEQRQLTGETDEQVQAKVALLLKHGLLPIVCIGETLEERQADRAIAKIRSQMETLLSALTRVSMSKLVIAYEPIWAIGSGEQPDSSEVGEIAVLLRKLAAARFGNEAAERMRVIYGGSVKANNAAPFVSEPGVDGVLAGGSSVHPVEFVSIVEAVKEVGKEREKP